MENTFIGVDLALVGREDYIAVVVGRFDGCGVLTLEADVLCPARERWRLPDMIRAAMGRELAEEVIARIREVHAGWHRGDPDEFVLSQPLG